MFARCLMFALAVVSPLAKSEAGVLDSVKRMVWGNPHKHPPKIQVLVVNDEPAVTLEVDGRYKVYDPNTKTHIGTRLVGKKKVLQSQPGGLKWGEEFPGLYQLQLIPDSTNTTIAIDGKEYKGQIFIYDIGGSLSVVNKVDLEDYLTFTLPQQFQRPIPEETLAAIAITARTNALWQAENPKTAFWDVDGKVVGYEGVVNQSPSEEMTEAIKTTKGMAMSATGAYEGVVSPFAAQWGSGTGGRSGKNDRTVFSRITLFEAEEMGQKGKDAAQILGKAFPDTHIELIR